MKTETATRTATRTATIVLGLLLFVSAFAAPPPRFEGVYRGTLVEKLRLVLSVSRAPDGKLTLVLDSVDQGATLPVDIVKVHDAKVRFEVTRVHGVFEGTLSSDGATLEGTWNQGSGAMPLRLTRDTTPTATTKAADRPPKGMRALDAPIDAFVPVPPTVFRSAKNSHVAYELHVTNFSRHPLTLERVETLSGTNVIAKTDAADLAARVSRPGASDLAGLDKLRIAAGQRAIVYLWVDFDGAVPKSLDHRVTVESDGNGYTLDVARILLSTDLVAISAPLRGANWVAANGPSNTSGHRRALIPVGGGAHIAQRFAIDWVRTDDKGASTFSGDVKSNKSYFAYGQDALAVADAPVVAVKDGIPDNVPGTDSRAVPITLETVGGNHVVLDLGKGRYAFYAHLQPGSLRVKVGDRVKRGQVIGLVGNTGNSTEPHLHFHVSSGVSPLASEGLPYRLVIGKSERDLPAEDEKVDFQ